MADSREPGLIDDIQSAQGAMMVFEKSPDLSEDSQRFREAMSGN